MQVDIFLFYGKMISHIPFLELINFCLSFVKIKAIDDIDMKLE